MRLTLFFLLNFFAITATAGIYKCTDENGHKVYRSGPCTEGYSNAEINLKTGSITDLDEQRQQEILKQNKLMAEREQETLAREQLLHKQAQLAQQTLDESIKNQEIIKSHPKQYSAFAMPPYSAEKLSPLVKNYAERLPEIERLRRQAAEKALQSRQCPRVEAVELNEKTKPEALMFLVDCSNAKKFYFTEQVLNAGQPK